MIEIKNLSSQFAISLMCYTISKAEVSNHLSSSPPSSPNHSPVSAPCKSPGGLCCFSLLPSRTTCCSPPSSSATSSSLSSTKSSPLHHCHDLSGHCLSDSMWTSHVLPWEKNSNGFIKLTKHQFWYWTLVKELQNLHLDDNFGKHSPQCVPLWEGEKTGSTFEAEQDHPLTKLHHLLGLLHSLWHLQSIWGGQSTTATTRSPICSTWSSLASPFAPSLACALPSLPPVVLPLDLVPQGVLEAVLAVILSGPVRWDPSSTILNRPGSFARWPWVFLQRLALKQRKPELDIKPRRFFGSWSWRWGSQGSRRTSWRAWAARPGSCRGNPGCRGAATRQTSVYWIGIYCRPFKAQAVGRKSLKIKGYTFLTASTCAFGPSGGRTSRLQCPQKGRGENF